MADSIRYADHTADYINTPNGGKRPDWNPDADYGNEYAKVYFRIDTTGYRYPEFTFSKEDGAAFDRAVIEVFKKLGWTCSKDAYAGRCSIWTNDKSHLYMHPQHFSGEVLKNEIKIVAEALLDAKSFKLERVDVYETVYDMTDEAYEEILKSKDDKIKEALLKACKTTRTYNFYRAEDVAFKIAKAFRTPRVGNSDGKNGGMGQTTKHILSVIETLVSEGYLISNVQGNNVLVRTINKSEQKQRHLKVA